MIPAAGYGTRFLPATKAVPKEMLPILNKPTIQFVLEEAVASGIDDVLIITGRSKQAVESHFDHAFELYSFLRSTGMEELADQLERAADAATIHYVRQKKAIGLGDAIRCAEDHMGGEPFACLLGDNIIRADPPCTAQLIDTFNEYGDSVVAVEHKTDDLLHRYGVIDGYPLEDRPDVYAIREIVEKPQSRDEAPSNLVSNGRFILTSDVYDHLRDLQPGLGGEVQLTDALTALARDGKLRALAYEGTRWYDTGNPFDYVIANLEAGLARPELKPGIVKYLKTVRG